MSLGEAIAVGFAAASFLALIILILMGFTVKKEGKELVNAGPKGAVNRFRRY